MNFSKQRETILNYLINSKEQMFTEKLRSILKFGPLSTRYKDIFDNTQTGCINKNGEEVVKPNKSKEIIKIGEKTTTVALPITPTDK